ncbi:hypothetical protein BN2475_340028 [Paraburkholderia ribeironis]|uniref:Uncharacterized protein n=1 Tax=Paraburkholderia ribeironis TaxID=1247936 RepID=A0A1N7S3R5_9BURK|nr:hypothetical protein BN2475_340028 [Paraburkholderia ribeironis]
MSAERVGLSLRLSIVIPDLCKRNIEDNTKASPMPNALTAFVTQRGPLAQVPCSIPEQHSMR